MSVFKSSGIVLKIHKMRDGKLLYTVFSDMYGKIMCSKKYSKTEKCVDVWYVINFEIITDSKSDISNIKNIKILSQFNGENKLFREINSYLELIALIKNSTAPWVEHLEIFEIIPIIHTMADDTKLSIKILLAKLKVMQLLWNLKNQDKDPTVQKILKFIHSYKTLDIVKLSWVQPEIALKLENICK